MIKEHSVDPAELLKAAERHERPKIWNVTDVLKLFMRTIGPFMKEATTKSNRRQTVQIFSQGTAIKPPPGTPRTSLPDAALLDHTTPAPLRYVKLQSW